MYLFCDIGGTKTRIAYLKDENNLEIFKVFKTPERFEEGILKIKNSVLDLIKKNNISYAVFGVAGPLNKEKTKMVSSPNLPDWAGKPLLLKLKEALLVSVVLENDSALAALGEATFGAGKDKKIVAYLTISTGVGGARIVDKKIDVNSYGFEPGHHILNIEEALCAECSERGEFQDYIGGRSIEAREGKRPEDIKDEKFWDYASKICAYGVNNAIVFWSPDVVVLGGGLIINSKEFGISLKKVNLYLKDILKIFPYDIQIKKAELGDFSVLYGGLSLIRNNNIKF